jgi:hypothetical protein
VLEFASGTIDATQTKPGDRLEFFPALPLSEGLISSDVSGAPEQSMEVNKV